MMIQIEPDEQLRIRVGERVWLFQANKPDEVWLHAESRGEKIYALAATTPDGSGARFDVLGDP